MGQEKMGLQKTKHPDVTSNKEDKSPVVWLVSTLWSQQRKIKELKEAGFAFADTHTVIRTFDFWKILLSRARPDLRLISKELLLSWLMQKLLKEDDVSLHSPSVAQLLERYLTQFISILSYPEGSLLLDEWLLQNPNSAMRWGKWWKLSRQLYDDLLSIKMIPASWASCFLLQESDWVQHWDQALVLEKDDEGSRVEMELLQQLQPFFVEDPLPPLSAVARRQQQQATGDLPHQSTSAARRFVQLSTALGEVKMAVAQVQKWLQAGVSHENIGILSPDINKYALPLEAHLRVEGIEFDRLPHQTLHAWVEVNTKLARLRLELGGYSSSDAELVLFSDTPNMARNEDRHLPYQNFRKQCSKIYSQSDLHGVIKIQAHLFDLQREYTSEEYIKILNDLFASDKLKSNFEDWCPWDHLLSLLHEEAPADLRLTPASWLLQLEHLASRPMLSLSEEDEVDPSLVSPPITVVNLSLGVRSSQLTHLAVIGLNEKDFTNFTMSGPLPLADVLKISTDLGFPLDEALQRDSGPVPNDWTSLLEKPEAIELLLTYAQTDFDGHSVAPSWAWLSTAVREAAQSDSSPNAGGVTPHPLRAIEPWTTKWDVIQQEKANISQVNSSQSFYMQVDMGSSELPAVSFMAHRQDLTLSPSAISNFIRCPFVWAARYLFGLDDSPYADLDLDAASRGRVLHAVLEVLSQDDNIFQEWTEEKLAELIAEQKRRLEIREPEPRMSVYFNRKHIQIFKDFILYEREWRRQFPKSKIFAREVAFKGFLNIETGEVCSTEKIHRKNIEQRYIAFRGFIDRIDTAVDWDDKVYGKRPTVIIDYKSSAFEIYSWSSCIDKGQLQLPLYAMSVEAGLVSDLPSSEVISAVYWVLPQHDRDKGFKISDGDETLYSLQDRKRNKITRADKQALFQRTQEILRAQVLEPLSSGRIAPAPRDPSSCPSCNWRDLCREPKGLGEL